MKSAFISYSNRPPYTMFNYKYRIDFDNLLLLFFYQVEERFVTLIRYLFLALAGNLKGKLGIVSKIFLL